MPLLRLLEELDCRIRALPSSTDTTAVEALLRQALTVTNPPQRGCLRIFIPVDDRLQEAERLIRQAIDRIDTTASQKKGA